MRSNSDVDLAGKLIFKGSGAVGKNLSEIARFYVSGTSCYICIKCIYIKQYHVIVSPKVIRIFFENDAD